MPVAIRSSRWAEAPQPTPLGSRPVAMTRELCGSEQLIGDSLLDAPLKLLERERPALTDRRLLEGGAGLGRPGSREDGRKRREEHEYDGQQHVAPGDRSESFPHGDVPLPEIAHTLVSGGRPGEDPHVSEGQYFRRHSEKSIHFDSPRRMNTHPVCRTVPFFSHVSL